MALTSPLGRRSRKRLICLMIDCTLPAYNAFLFIKAIALTTKHGFSEEQDSQIMNIPGHDPRGYLKSNFSYHIGPRGVERTRPVKARGQVVSAEDGNAQAA